MSDSSKNVFLNESVSTNKKFLANNPNFDGRQIVIAIIDGCIDMSLPGMQQTSTGLPKIIECIDFTGNGNINTSHIGSINKDNVLIGLTGRELKIPLSWINPSNEWHLGIKSIYEFCVDHHSLDYIIKKRKETIYQKNKAFKENQQKNMKKKDYKMIQKYLKSVEENLPKNSLVADCIVWFDGNQWLACIDTSFCGNLKNIKAMTNFKDNHEYDFIFEKISYCFSIYDNGNLLEVYVPFGDHGTAVAHIAAGYFPDNRKLDGMAPGAQILAYNVMDPRNEFRMNCRVFKNALQKCIEMKADIVNLSLSGFPEDTYSLIKEMVEKHGILILKANGNGGPVYSSVDHLPLKFQHLILNIGSVSYDESSVKNCNYPTLPFTSTYSSRGPFLNGACFETIMAHGEAISCVPKFFPCKNKFQRGTSLSCANAAGAIACLLSALKANSIKISIFKLKLALLNTAIIPEGGGDQLAYGSGTIQIDNAFKFYQKNLNLFPKEITSILAYSKPINSVFKTSFSKYFNSSIIIKKEGKFEYCLKIIVKNLIPSENNSILWKLKLPQNVDSFITISKTAANDTYLITIDTHLLKLNTINHIEIHGSDKSNPQWGKLFRFPITIILPRNVENNSMIKENLVLLPRIPSRLFISPSIECEHCILKLIPIGQQKTTPSNIRVQYSVPDGGEVNYNTKIFKFYPQITKMETWCFSIECYDVQEICIVQEENLSETFKYKMELHFFGFTVNSFYFPAISYLPINFMFIKNIFQPFSTALSINFESITYILRASNVIMEPFNVSSGKRYFKVMYNLQVKKHANCLFSPFYYLHLKTYVTHIFQIFTLSKKYISGFINKTTKGLLLPAGNYLIVGHFEYEEKTILQKILTSVLFLPYIEVTMEFEKIWTPQMYKKIMKTQNSKITKNDVITFEKNQNLMVYFDEIPSNFILPSPWRYISHLNGYLEFHFENTKYEYPIRQVYYPFKQFAAEMCNFIKDSANDWQNMIKHYYSQRNCPKLITTVDSFLNAINAKYFLKNYQNFTTDLNIFEQKLLLERKSAIINILFLKADAILDKFLNENLNIPMVIKEKLITLSTLFSSETLQKGSTFIDYCKATVFPFIPKIDFKNAIETSAKSSKIEAIKVPQSSINVTRVCQEFFITVDERDIRRSIIMIKKSFNSGNYGTSLFYLNKISAENPISKFKVVDEIIIEVLQHYKCHHLIEAHGNALLDRYQNYYRTF